jgi:hypothetical protein
MKALHEYETPETEAQIQEQWVNHLIPYPPTDFTRDLEQRLAACRDKLKQIANSSSSSRIRREARETLNLTSLP